MTKTQNYDHVIYVLSANGQNYAYHQALPSYHDYKQSYHLPHAGRQLVLDTPYKSWTDLCQDDTYYQQFTPVNLIELIRLHQAYYPDSTITPVVKPQDLEEQDPNN